MQRSVNQLSVLALWLTLGAACGGHAIGGDDPGGSGGGGGDPSGGSGPSGGGDPGGGDPGGGDPGGGETCTTVCWAPAARPITPIKPPPVTNITIPDCNSPGIANDICPTGFACTGTQTELLGPNITLTRPICEPAAPIVPLVFDLPVDVPGKVAVQLDFTLNGGAWPTSPNPGAAGTITFVPHGPGPTVSLPIPTQSGELDLDLAPGQYNTSISFDSSNFDASRYPSLTMTGVLTVISAGRATLPFKGQPLTYSLRLDGGTFPALTASDFVSMYFRGGHGQEVIFFGGSPGTAPSGTVVLEPDTYRVWLDVSAFGTPPTLPNGEAVLAEALEVTAPATVAFNATTFPISGTVRVDGADLPRGVAATVSIGQNSFTVPAARPARYQGRVFAGTYEVMLDTRTSSSNALPHSTVRVRQDFVAGPPTLDIAATTTTFSGTATLNNATPANSANRGVIVLTPPGSTSAQLIPLATTGAAIWNARVYAGSYDVALAGGGPLPAYSVPLEQNVAITSPTAKTYNVNAGTATLTLLDNGSQPVDTIADRGTFTLYRTGATVPSATFAFAPQTGPLRVSLPLEAGTWRVEYTTGAGYDGLPLGTGTLGNIEVTAGTATTTTFNAQGMILAGELRRGGQALAPAEDGHTRGLVSLSNIDMSQVSQALPATGAATFSFRVFPGIYDFTLGCSGTCDTLDPHVDLASGIRFP